MIEHLYIIPVLLFSVIIHEIAHGWVALRLGDPTAKALGRLTLNPIPHIDLIGSILVPLASLAAAGTVFIAWAKPVPINPGFFRNPRRDDVLVSLAGPLSNLLLATMFALVVGCLIAVVKIAGSVDDPSPVLVFVLNMLYAGVYLNVVLALFNLLPIPPLDGSHLLASLLPARAAYWFTRLGFAGIVVVILVMRIPQVQEAFHALIVFVVSPLQSLMGVE